MSARSLSSLPERANPVLAVRCLVEERIPQSLHVNEVRHAAVIECTSVIEYAVAEKPREVHSTLTTLAVIG